MRRIARLVPAVSLLLATAIAGQTSGPLSSQISPAPGQFRIQFTGVVTILRTTPVSVALLPRPGRYNGYDVPPHLAYLKFDPAVFKPVVHDHNAMRCDASLGLCDLGLLRGADVRLSFDGSAQSARVQDDLTYVARLDQILDMKPRSDAQGMRLTEEFLAGFALPEGSLHGVCDGLTRMWEIQGQQRYFSHTVELVTTHTLAGAAVVTLTTPKGRLLTLRYLGGDAVITVGNTAYMDPSHGREDPHFLLHYLAFTRDAGLSETLTCKLKSGASQSCPVPSFICQGCPNCHDAEGESFARLAWPPVLFGTRGSNCPPSVWLP